MTQTHPRALILDDDPTLARFILLCLEGIGVSVTTASGFSEFKKKLDDPTGFVIIDLKMPDADGVEVLRYLSRIGYSGRVTIVSGASREILESVENLARRYGLRVTGFLRKPFKPLDLQRHLSRYLMPHLTRSTRDGVLARDDISQLLDAGLMRAHYQPKMSLRDGSLQGFEALLRCHHPKLGVLGPASFLGVVEGTALADRINMEAFELVLRDMARWRTNGTRQKVAINIGARQLADLALPDAIQNWIRRYGVDPRDVTVEVTETTFTNEMVHALEVLTRLRLKDIRLSIDDFGTGYSTEDRLRDLPFNELKIDGGLVANVASDPDSRHHVQRCVELGRQLGLTVVAECVETQIQVETLSRLGVAQAQGYLMAKPMPAAEVPVWCQSVDQVGRALSRVAQGAVPP